MAKTVQLDVQKEGMLAALQDFLASLLGKKRLEAVLVPCLLPVKETVMPTLVSDPEKMKYADPLSPAFPLNSARIVSRLTRVKSGKRLGALLRPCEIRAFVELVKLNQGSMDDIVIIGLDCPGACTNREFFAHAEKGTKELTESFCRDIFMEKKEPGVKLSEACSVCEDFTPEGADIRILLFGYDPSKGIIAEAATSKGQELVERMGLKETGVPDGRQKTLRAMQEKRAAALAGMFDRIGEMTSDIAGLSNYLGNCVNCYNCRVACPVCYCRECVFVTDVFDHDPDTYLMWANKRGAIKMPTDTLFYHITRMAHMSTACVGCGQCSNACPNEIGVMELFRFIARKTQKGFEYTPGRSADDRPPLSVFSEKEFEDVIGFVSPA